MGRFQGQRPHWLGLKSQYFHNLSGIDERIVKEIFGSQSMAQGLKRPDKNYASMHPMDPKSMYLFWRFYIVSKDSTSLLVHG